LTHEPDEKPTGSGPPDGGMTKAVAGLLLLYGVTRGWRLLALPIVNDEAIYIRWASIIRDTPANLFLPSLDGKTPLFMWLNALSLGLVDDPLLSGRILSVLAGVLALVGVLRLGTRLFSNTVGLWAAAIYVVLPFSLIHDRFALVDSLLNACIIWTLLLALRLDRSDRRRWWRAVGLGLVMGAGFLTKTSFVALAFLPGAALLLLPGRRGRDAWLRLAVAYAVALVICLPYLLHDPAVSSAGSSKLFHNVSFLGDPGRIFAGSTILENLGAMAGAVARYLGWPVAALLAFSWLGARREELRRRTILWLWIGLPCLAIVLLLTNIYSRYYLFVAAPSALLAARTLEAAVDRFQRRESRGGVGARPIRVGVTILLLLPALSFDGRLLSDPRRAPWTSRDAWQYTASEYSGDGIAEAVELLREQAASGSVAVFTSYTWGVPGDALFLYLRDEPQVSFYEAWWMYERPLLPPDPGALKIYRSKYEPTAVRGTLTAADLVGRRIFFVARDSLANPPQLLRDNPGLTPLRSFHRLDDGYAFTIYTHLQE